MEIADDDEDNALTQWIEKKFGTDDEGDSSTNCLQLEIFFQILQY